MIFVIKKPLTITILSLYLEKGFMSHKSRNSNRKFAFKLKTAINCTNIYNACYFYVKCWHYTDTLISTRHPSVKIWQEAVPEQVSVCDESGVRMCRLILCPVLKSLLSLENHAIKKITNKSVHLGKLIIGYFIICCCLVLLCWQWMLPLSLWRVIDISSMSNWSLFKHCTLYFVATQ